MKETSPPIPRSLRDAFADLPRHLERVQEVLESISKEHVVGDSFFQNTAWALQSRLEAFYFEADEELQKAKERGDEGEIEAATNKKTLMARMSGKQAWIADPEFRAYFIQSHDLKE